MTLWPFRGNRGNKHLVLTSSTTETELIPAYEDDAGNDIFVDIYSLIIANTSATKCTVTIRDEEGGDARIAITVPAGETRGFAVPKPEAHQQTVAGEKWTAQCSDSVDAIKITALFARNT